MSFAAFHDFEQAGWEHAADFYPAAFGNLTAQAADALLDAAGVDRGMRVLDVASGPGYVASAAAARGATVVGIDFAPAMVAAARQRHPPIDFRYGDAEALAFGEAEFDAVVMGFGLLHLARPEAAIAEAHRVVRPGGRYAVTVWAPPDQTVGFGVVLDAIQEHGRTDVGLPDGPPFFGFSDAGRARTTLERAGFGEVDVRVIPLVWRLPSVDTLFDAMSRGGVRTAAVLRAQIPAALDRIRDDIRRRVEPYTSGDGACHVPMPAVLVSATRPR